MISKNNEIFGYIKALQNIYGVYEADQLAVVWNKYNEEKLDKEKIYEFMAIAGRRQNYFWWDEPYIISDYFQDEEEYKGYLMIAAGRKYYIPTKGELKYYMENDFDENSIYYIRMLSFFEKNDGVDHVTLEYLMLTIRINCTLDNPFQRVVDEIVEDGFDFKSFEDLNKFAKLYMDLSNNSRKWSIRGYKPNELQRMESKVLKNNTKNNLIPFPKPIVSKAKKIGRNDSCPCGSGKKYKFCCGK